MTNNSQVVKGCDPLAGWKSKLTDLQVNNILAVLKVFKMEFDRAALEPDYEKLAAFERSSKGE